MWRAFFLAIGATLCILGVECLVLDSVVLAADGPLGGAAVAPTDYDPYGFEVDSMGTSETRSFSPPEWAPWSLLSTGAIVLLYSLGMTSGGDE